MSSISSSDRARQTDEVRNAREEYQEKEAELIKKQKKELQKIQQRYDKDVDVLRDSYADQVSNLKEKSHEIITKRDMDNKDKIEKIRGLYLEQLKRKTEEGSSRTEQLENAYKAKLNKEAQIKEQQKTVLKRSFDDSIQERDRQMSEFTTNAREQMREALSSRTQKLNEKHNSEMGSVIKDRDSSVSNLQKTLDDTKSANSNERKQGDRLARAKVDRMNSNFVTQFQNQEHQNASLIESRNQMLQAERNSAKGKYNNALERKLSSLDEAHKMLEDQVADRLERQVRSAKADLSRAKNDRTIDNITNRRIRNLEQGHLRDAYEERMMGLEKERDGMLEVANEITHKRVDNVLNRTEKLIQDTNQNNKLKMNMLNQRNSEDRAQVEMNTKSQLEHIRGKTDQRVSRIMGESAKTQINQEKLHNKTVDELKNSYYENLASNREAQSENLKNIQIKMEERLHANQSKALARHENTLNNFEKKIADMEEKHQQSIKRLEDSYKQRLQGQEKSHKMELDSQGQKVDIQVGQLEANHKQELDRMEKRHQEQMQSLTKQVKYYRGKA